MVCYIAIGCSVVPAGHCVGGLGCMVLLLLVRLLAQGLDGADWLVQLTTGLAVVW